MSNAQTAGFESLAIGIFLVGLFAFNMKTGYAGVHIFLSAKRSESPKTFWFIQAVVVVLALVWLIRSGLELFGPVAS